MTCINCAYLQRQAGRQAVEQGEERQLFVNGFLLDRVSIFNDLDLALIVLRALIVALRVYVARCTYVCISGQQKHLTNL